MSSSIESRIVSMKFDNRDFERGVSTTLRSLGTLGKALDAGFTSKAVGGLSRVGSAIRGFSFGNMGGGAILGLVDDLSREQAVARAAIVDLIGQHRELAEDVLVQMRLRPIEMDRGNVARQTLDPLAVLFEQRGQFFRLVARDRLPGAFTVQNRHGQAS